MRCFPTREHEVDYKVQGRRISLRQHPNVAPASSFSVQLAQRIDVAPGERVADVGSGTGILAILAAKAGAEDIVATDNSAIALTTAQFNASELNGASAINFRYGHFFAGAGGVFDVILANLPQDIVPEHYLTRLNKEQTLALDGGGAGGNALILDFLDAAPYYMKDSSRLYVSVNTATDYRATLRAIAARYNPRMIWQGTAPAKDYVSEYFDWFKVLLRHGAVDIFPDAEGCLRTRHYIYELRRLADRVT
jgi:methylase of polypeptide subunit release factors